MKKVIGMLAVVAFASSMASAELLKNFKYTGAIEVGAISVDNVDYDNNTDDQLNGVLSRVTLGANFDLNDDVNAQVTAIKNARKYGTNPESAINGALDAFNFEEAYLNLKGVLGMDHKLGRQYYGNAGDLVVYYGPLMMPYDPAFTVNAIDGWTGWWNSGKWTANAIIAKTICVNGKVDTNVIGLKGGYNLNEKANLGVYVYQKMVQNTATVKPFTPNDNLNVGGVKVNGKYVGVEYNVEGAMNFGKNTTVATGYAAASKTTKYQGTAVMANAKYAMTLGGKMNFEGEFAMGSGDKTTTDAKVQAFATINSDYRLGFIYGGYQNNAGITNLTTWNVGAHWTPTKVNKLTICAKFYDLKYTEKVGTVTKIGNEIDFGANWQHSEKTSVALSYGMFTPNRDYSFPAGKSAETKLGLDFMVKF